MDPPQYSAVTEKYDCQIAFIMGVVIAFLLMTLWHCTMRKYSGYTNVTSSIIPSVRHNIDINQNKAAQNLNRISAANANSFLASADTTENLRDSFEMTDPAVASAIKRNQIRNINQVAAATAADDTDFSALAKGTKAKGFKPIPADESFQMTDRRIALLDSTLPQRYKWRLSRARDDEFDVYRTPASSAFV